MWCCIFGILPHSETNFAPQVVKNNYPRRQPKTWYLETNRFQNLPSLQFHHPCPLNKLPYFATVNPIPNVYVNNSIVQNTEHIFVLFQVEFGFEITISITVYLVFFVSYKILVFNSTCWLPCVLARLTKCTDVVVCVFITVLDPQKRKNNCQILFFLVIYIMLGVTRE